MADVCSHYGQELEPSHTGPCPHCRKTGKACDVAVNDGIIVGDGFRLRQKRKGFEKFMAEIISRRLSSSNPKLPKGILEHRAIDKEHNAYDQVVKDATSGEIIHEEHVPLNEHKTEPERKP